MDIAVVREFFKWCTIINMALLMFSAAIVACTGDWIYRKQGAWYKIPRETFNVVMYCFLGFFKLLIIVFNLVPYIALVIVG